MSESMKEKRDKLAIELSGHFPPCQIHNLSVNKFYCRKCKKWTSNPRIEVLKGSLTDFQEIDIPFCPRCGLSMQIYLLESEVKNEPDAKN